MIKPLESVFFTNRRGCCGIVLGENENTGERCLYAGAVSGDDQKAGEIEILTWGNKVNTTRLESMLSKLKGA